MSDTIYSILSAYEFLSFKIGFTSHRNTQTWKFNSCCPFHAVVVDVPVLVSDIPSWTDGLHPLRIQVLNHTLDRGPFLTQTPYIHPVVLNCSPLTLETLS